VLSRRGVVEDALLCSASEVRLSLAEPFPPHAVSEGLAMEAGGDFSPCTSLRLWRCIHWPALNSTAPHSNESHDSCRGSSLCAHVVAVAEACSYFSSVHSYTCFFPLDGPQQWNDVVIFRSKLELRKRKQRCRRLLYLYS
jgi:hypothetical protein